MTYQLENVIGKDRAIILLNDGANKLIAVKLIWELNRPGMSIRDSKKYIDAIDDEIKSNEYKSHQHKIANYDALLNALKVAKKHIEDLYEYEEANDLYGDSLEYDAINEVIASTIAVAENNNQ